MMAVISIEVDDKPSSAVNSNSDPVKAAAAQGSAGSAIAMGVPYVQSFCCCLGLEVGTKLVAFAHLAISLILVTMCSLFAAQLGALRGTAEDAGDGVYAKWYPIAVAVAVISTGHVVLAATLLYGAYKRSTACLLTWVSTMALLFCISVGFVVVNTALTGVSGSGSDIFIAFLEGVIFFGVLAYCILTVYSFYLMVKSSQDMEGPGMPY